MTRSRGARLLLAGVLAGLLTLAVLVAWQSYRVASTLATVAEDADSAREAIRGGDGIDASVAALQSSASEAANAVNDWRWSLVTRLPWVGDDASGVRLVADVVSDLSSDIVPAAEASADLTRLLPRDGRIDIRAVRDLQEPVAGAADALVEADTRLAAADPTDFVGPLRTKYEDLHSQVGDAAAGLDAASVATRLLPVILGAEGPRNFLLVFQNNAEIRATGGLPGTLSIVTTDDGAIDLGRQVATNSFGERDTPVLPLSRDEKAVFTDYLGVFALDANFTPDWPRASDLLKARYEETYPERLDGTITLDTVAISYLLSATGPVEVDGYTLTEANAVDVLLNRIYLDIADPRAQDAFFQEVAATMFERISSGDVGRPRELLEALARATGEGRVAMHLFDDEQQESLDGRAIAHQTTDDNNRSSAVDVTMNDGTGAKMSYYLDYEVTGRATSCVDGRQQTSVEATLRSTAPTNAGKTLPPYVTGGGRYGVPPGNQIVETRVFTPSGGIVTGFWINGEEFEVKDLQLGDRAVSTAYVYLEPGRTVDVQWKLSFAAQNGVVPLRVTPGIVPESESSLISPAC